MDWKSLFFSGEGRIGRQTFWIGFAILLGAFMVLNVIPGVGHLLIVAMNWCWVCLYAKRLHDMDRSGWLAVIPYAVGFASVVIAILIGGAGFIAAAMHGENNAAGSASMVSALGGALVVAGIACLINLAFLLWVGVTASTPGDNAYGPQPGAAPAIAVAGGPDL